MVKKGSSSSSFVVILLVLLVLGVADGSDDVVQFKLRKLVGLKPDSNNTTANSTTTQISPSPGPIPAAVGSNQTDVNSNVTVPKSPQIPVENTTNVDQNDTGAAAAAGGVTQEGIDEKCSAKSNKCTTEQKDMIACLLPIGLQEFFLLVQNEGESNLEVNISVSASVKADLKELKIPKHRAKKTSVSVIAEGISTISLHAGSGECVLHTGRPVSPKPKANYFRTITQMPFYTTLTQSPIYGAYFLFVVALVIGGSWACCKFGKRDQQHGTGVPYQELEMTSSSVVNVESADGWDNSWDDDWDEGEAVRSPGRQQTGNLSANGLTSRPPGKDEWGNDWDD
ncbi:hypothetical protein C5167_024720 [Papaver somniferum]|uniref:DUF7356 domain-containing protein n=1 Tax=Papaver somniferum TaxID=3469 RepID=A0A4Y7JSQ4_PAPSO|nr:uncharacterized protein LOC113283657 [Papaver somniferum]RZC62971.1 hypothetical protein C5167_024720 [Papaver somniferum]